MLSKGGVEVPAPSSYRKLIRGFLRSAAKTAMSDDARDVILEAVAPEHEPDRLVLSGPSFLGTPKMAAGGGTLYSSMEARLGYLHRIFRDDQCEFFFSIKNLASFLPSAFEATSFSTMAEFLRGTDPTEMRWYDLILRLRNAYPDLPINIWCNEDTPLIWAEILKEMSGLGDEAVFDGEYALLEEIMSKPGMQRFNAYVASRPGMTKVQKRRVIAAFLDKFAEESAIEEELDVPGWTEELVDRLTELYDEDVLSIQSIPGVNMIAP